MVFFNNPHRLLPFLDCNLVPRVFSVFIGKREDPGYEVDSIDVEIKSVSFALVFQVLFYCDVDVDVGKTQSFKTAFCTLPNVCLIKFPGLFDGLKGARYGV